MIGIYKITSPTSKVYIGQSVDITSRWNQHRRSINNKGKTKLINSFIKYGIDNHIFEIVEICEASDLNNRERYWQEYYDVMTDGLNLKLTKSDDKSGYASEETKLKMSIGIKKAFDEGKNPSKTKRILKEIEKEREERRLNEFYI